VAKAPPDGYTLIIGNAGSHGINAAVCSQLPYDIQRDFAPVCKIAIAPNIMVVNPELPTANVQHHRYAKARPGDELCIRRQRQQRAHVVELFNPWPASICCTCPTGSSPALTDVVTGQVSAMIVNMPPAVPFVKAGSSRHCGDDPQPLTIVARSPRSPAGLPGYETVAWFGILAPAATPSDIVIGCQRK
jgi:tripartite-type tricarboxylate transporter receptor subunit TctC